MISYTVCLKKSLEKRGVLLEKPESTADFFSSPELGLHRH